MLGAGDTSNSHVVLFSEAEMRFKVIFMGNWQFNISNLLFYGTDLFFSLLQCPLPSAFPPIRVLFSTIFSLNASFDRV